MNDEPPDGFAAIRRQVSLAHAEALKVGDSPLRADRLADQIERIRREVDPEQIGDERAARLGTSLDDAIRVLRRDDDGREAARHLQKAMSSLEPRLSRPSPFLDD